MLMLNLVISLLVSYTTALDIINYAQHPQCMQEIAQGLDAKECLDYEKGEIERKMRKQLLPEFSDEEGDELLPKGSRLEENVANVEISDDMKSIPTHIDVSFAAQTREKLLMKGTEFDVQGLDHDSWIRAHVISVTGDLITIEFDCLYTLSIPIWVGGESLFEIVELFQEGLLKWPDDTKVKLDGFGFRINDYCIGPVRPDIFENVEFEFQDMYDDRWIQGKIVKVRGNKVTVDYLCREMSEGLIESTVDNFERWVLPLAEASRFVWIKKPGKYAFRENLYENRPDACKHDRSSRPLQHYSMWIADLRENYQLLHKREVQERLKRQAGVASIKKVVFEGRD